MPDGSTPTPLVLESQAETLKRYSAVAAELGFAPGDLVAARIVELCRENGIPVYPLETVEARMSGPGEHPAPWNWVPLRALDVQAKPSPYWQGHQRVLGVPYSRLVPVEHLRAALKIQAAFPEVWFFVAASVEPDPFLAAWGETMREPVVFAAWDEPGFGGDAP